MPTTRDIPAPIPSPAVRSALPRADRVLIVEDDELTRTILARVLETYRRHCAPLMSISIGIVRTDTHPLDSPVAIAAAAGEMKAVAKLMTGSALAVDGRRSTDLSL